jgi:hypothetical protein
VTRREKGAGPLSVVSPSRGETKRRQWRGKWKEREKEATGITYVAVLLVMVTGEKATRYQS